MDITRKFLTVALLLLFLSVSAFADSPPGGGCGPDGDGTPCDETGEEENIPLDDHVLYLVGGSIAVGIAYFRKTDRDLLNI